MASFPQNFFQELQELKGRKHLLLAPLKDCPEVFTPLRRILLSLFFPLPD
jgi:hypothetical protein